MSPCTRIAEWIEKFVEHCNGVAIAPDFTSTEWWHALTEQADIIMFVRPKISFLPKREDGRTNSLGSTLVAMGERGVQALRNAERNGRGLCFQRDAGAVPVPMVANPLVGRRCLRHLDPPSVERLHNALQAEAKSTLAAKVERNVDVLGVTSRGGCHVIIGRG